MVFLFDYFINDTTLETKKFSGSFFSKNDVIMPQSKQDDLLLVRNALCEPVCMLNAKKIIPYLF